jgi:hypothetical protein
MHPNLGTITFFPERLDILGGGGGGMTNAKELIQVIGDYDRGISSDRIAQKNAKLALASVKLAAKKTAADAKAAEKVHDTAKRLQNRETEKALLAANKVGCLEYGSVGFISHRIHRTHLINPAHPTAHLTGFPIGHIGGGDVKRLP